MSLKTGVKETLLFIASATLASLFELVVFCGLYNHLAPFTASSLGFFSISRVVAMLAICYIFRTLINFQKIANYDISRGKNTDIDKKNR